MPQYVPVIPDEPEAIKKLTPAKKAKLKMADSFISRWISKITPEELEKAILTNADPKIAWNAEGLKSEASSLIRMVKLGNALAGIFSNSKKSMSSGILEHYLTYEYISLYLDYAQSRYPLHIRVIRRLAPGSIYYLQNGIKVMLKDLL